MLTQFFLNINWVDVALLLCLIRIVFISVTTGLVIEGFKFLGVFLAAFIALHEYRAIAWWVTPKTSLPLESWEFLIFTVLCFGIYLAIKFLRDGLLILFKVEATHVGFNKYAAGVIGVLRAILTGSLVVFAVLLLPHKAIHDEAATSIGKRLVAPVSVGMYRFTFEHVIGKIFDAETFNKEVLAVIGQHGVHPKRDH